jgi:hypothetical protein
VLHLVCQQRAVCVHAKLPPHHVILPAVVPFPAERHLQCMHLRSMIISALPSKEWSARAGRERDGDRTGWPPSPSCSTGHFFRAGVAEAGALCASELALTLLPRASAEPLPLAPLLAVSAAGLL